MADPQSPLSPSERQTALVLAAPPSTLETVELSVRPESRLVGFGNGNIFGVEEFRLLCTRMLELQNRTALKRVLITSAWPSEGKTQIAVNLAITLARDSESRVPLIDGDLRKPELDKVFGVANDGYDRYSYYYPYSGSGRAGKLRGKTG